VRARPGEREIEVVVARGGRIAASVATASAEETRGVVLFVEPQDPDPLYDTPAAQLPLVQAAPLEFRDGALRVTGHGLVKPRAEVVLGVEVPGRLVFVSPSLAAGGAFARGDVLLRLDEAPYRAALAQAEAELASARAGLQLAEQQLERARELIAQGFQSRQALDERTGARDQAAAALARAQALVSQRRLDLERTVVHAPFDGKVLSARVDRGESVQPGKELARFYAQGALEIAVSLTDREMALVADPWRAGNGDSRGAAASVEVEHGGGLYRWPARVARVETSVDATTRTFNVVVRVDNPAARGAAVRGNPQAAPPLLVGMYATAHIEGVDPGRHALVPRRALREGDALWLLEPGGTLRVRPVRVLQVVGERVAVSGEGLPEGVRIVVSDLKVVTDGMRVRELGAGERRASP
jgi:RND family efflux transporter MFP subunit